MNQLSVADAGGPRSLALADDELIQVLRSSLYPGARDDSIKLVLGYCRAAALDPMQKPVHIVPMRVKKVGGGRDEYEWRDTVMPGIGLYRTQAARTGELAGIDEPEFGPDMPMPGGRGAVTVPEWCRVTVYRMIGGQRVAFTAREYWLENYATSGRDSVFPNAMWERRPRGQIAKCAEAQALRKAFPELGSQPTADETLIDPADAMPAGYGAAPAPAPAAFKVQRKAPAVAHHVDADGVIDVPGVQVQRELVPSAPAPAPAPVRARPVEVRQDVPNGEALIGPGEVAYLRNKANSVGADLNELIDAMGCAALEQMTRAQFAAAKASLMAME